MQAEYQHHYSVCTEDRVVILVVLSNIVLWLVFWTSQLWANLPLPDAYPLGNEEQEELPLPDTYVLGNKEVINREESL